MKTLTLKQIATIQTDFTDKFGIPRQSGRVPGLTGKIIFEPQYRNPDALRKLEGFSHIWVIFGFSETERDEDFRATVRPPRLGGNERVGVFASRSPNRPNPIGLSVFKIVKIENCEITVSGVDLLNGTPIYDIKPYLPSADRIENAAGGYADEFTGYKLEVIIDDKLKPLIPPDKLDALIGCLAEDPRPSYQSDGREYGMSYAGLEIRFRVNGKTLTITGVT
ncbi:MAG: tRNA (N6-threonylcarbamoyladenosine(37)-N6)-methyltransferase TrmO [Clostridia bacterium]|nr:tRNA (N6-threonylcarbamoyladenosine(37)-N6)-methyltransferase TrmO [Clostridia bacterium]